MLKKLISIRFELLLVSQVAILFGSLIIPDGVFLILTPILFYLNILAGSLFIGHQTKGNVLILITVLLIIGGVFTLGAFQSHNIVFDYLKMAVLFVFHLIVSYNIVKQLWIANKVNKNLIMGLMSGFISLGLIGFFICLSIEIVHPDSFTGLSVSSDDNARLTDRVMYFSYITLMTIGYGDIAPITPLAQKATILIGLIGQFYLVIVTAIVVGKFINQNQGSSSDTSL